MECPICKKDNKDDWPVDVDGKIVGGGCQDCWETQCDSAFWEIWGKVVGSGAE